MVKKKVKPNYIISKFCWKQDGGVFRYWLEESKDFYKPNEIKETTYYKDGKFYVIEKIENE